MSETTENGKKVYEYIENIEALEGILQSRRMIYLVSGKKDTPTERQKFEIYYEKPVLSPEMLEACADEEAFCQNRYNCSLNDVLEKGIRGFATSPNYPHFGFLADGNLKENGHQAMQAQADAYQVGRKASAGPGVKQKASDFDKLLVKAQEAGFDSVEEWIASMGG